MILKKMGTENKKLLFLISNLRLFVIFFITIVYTTILDYDKDITNFFLSLYSVWLIFFAYCFCYYKIYDTFIVRHCILKKRKIISFDNIEKVIYSTIDWGIGPKIIIKLKNKKRFWANVSSDKKAQKILLFFQSKGVEVEIESRFMKDKELLKRDVKPGFFYRKLSFLYGDRGIF